MVMLSPELTQFVPKDSLEAFYRDYKLILENEFIHQETNGALLQNSMYNYQVHDKMRQNAERTQSKILIALFAMIAIIATLTAIILYMRYRNKGKVIELHEAMAKLKVLENATANKKRDENDESSNHVIDSRDVIVPDLLEMPKRFLDEKSLKIELRTKLKELNSNADSPYKVSSQIAESEAYHKMRSYLNNGDPIPDRDGVWREVENVVLKCFPNFKSMLQLLSDGDLNDDDLRIALLLKCGFSLSEISVLIGRTKGAITYRRKKLSVRLFGENLNLELVDNIIRTL